MLKIKKYVQQLKRKHDIEYMHQHTDDVSDMSIIYDQNGKIKNKTTSGDLGRFDQQYGRIDVCLPNGQMIMQLIKVPDKYVEAHQSRDYVHQAMNKLIQTVKTNQHKSEFKLPTWVPKFELKKKRTKMRWELMKTSNFSHVHNW